MAFLGIVAVGARIFLAVDGIVIGFDQLLRRAAVVEIVRYGLIGRFSRFLGGRCFRGGLGGRRRCGLRSGFLLGLGLLGLLRPWPRQNIMSTPGVRFSAIPARLVRMRWR